MDEELKRKLLFTLLALVIYRVGAHIAAPGVNVTALADFIRNSAAAGFFGLYDALGGGLSRATVFALGPARLTSMYCGRVQTTASSPSRRTVAKRGRT